MTSLSKWTLSLWCECAPQTRTLHVESFPQFSERLAPLKSGWPIRTMLPWGLDAVILEVEFSGEGGRVKLVEIDGKSDLNGAGAAATFAPVPATHSQSPRPSYWK